MLPAAVIPARWSTGGVFVADGVEIFHVGPMEGGTNNVGEFLAIVHALALLKRERTIFQSIPTVLMQ